MDELVRPVSARSAILSILLGSEPPSLTSREICAATTLVGYAESTARVAASRMVAAGDMVRDGRTYTLSSRLLERRRRTEAAVHPQLREWSGDWEMVVVTAVGRSPGERATLRADLAGLGLAELREGVWMRPDNLARTWPAHLDEVCRRLVVQPIEDPADLVAELWDLATWSQRGDALLAVAESDDPHTRFAAVTAVVRHLLADPLLPADLLPRTWPGERLRAAYDDFRAWTDERHLAAFDPPLRDG